MRRIRSRGFSKTRSGTRAGAGAGEAEGVGAGYVQLFMQKYTKGKYKKQELELVFTDSTNI